MKRIAFVLVFILLFSSISFADIDGYKTTFSDCTNDVSCWLEGISHPDNIRVWSDAWMQYIYIPSEKKTLFELTPNPAASVQYFCKPASFSPPTVACSFNANDGFAQAAPSWKTKFGISGAHALYTGTDQGCGWYLDDPFCHQETYPGSGLPKYSPPGVPCCLPVKITKPQEDYVQRCKMTATVSGGVCYGGTCYEGCGLNGGCYVTSCNSWSGTLEGHVEGDYCIFDNSPDYKIMPGTNCNGEIPGGYPVQQYPTITGTIDYFYSSPPCQSSWTCDSCSQTGQKSCNDGCGNTKTEACSCAQIITYAKNDATGECKQYPNVCIPDGWTSVTNCVTQPPVPKPKPDFWKDPAGAVLDFLACLWNMLLGLPCE